MARIWKRGKVWQYEISYKKDDGKYGKIRKSGFRTKADANAEASEVESKLSKGMKVADKDVLLSDHFEQWMKIYKKGTVSEITYRKYETTLNTIKDLFAYQTVRSITKTEYQKVLNEYAKDHAKGTVLRLNTHIRSSLANLLDEGVIGYDFTKGALIKGNDGKASNEKYLDYDDFKKLINAAIEQIDPHFATPLMIVVGGATGMRFGELLALTWDRVDLKNGVITIDRAWDYKQAHDFCPTKNVQSVRKINIDPTTIGILKQFKTDQEELLKKLEIALPSPFVFYNVKSGIVSNNAANKEIKLLCKKLKIKEITFHGLRHTHASIMIFKGVNLMAISKHLGHANLAITTNTYSHTLKELEFQESQKMKSIFDDIYQK